MSKPNILIVDDLIENLISLEMILSDFDVSFFRAMSGPEALRKTLTEDFALAIMDVQMPGMDGYETLSLMRKRKKTKYLPVIFVSAIHQSDLHIIKGIETGAVDFIPKPVIPEILAGKVKIFLDLYEQKAELNKLLKKLEENNRELAIQREKAEAATHTKAMFLANMSHEIRTPLNGIIGVSKALEDSGLNPYQNELNKTIATSGENLLNIINDILDFSKIEAGQIQLESIEFNLPDVISNIIKLLHFNANEKGLTLKVEVNKKIPQTLVGDPFRLSQIITNLVNNAIKFTEKGHIVISADMTEKDRTGIGLVLKVIDTGIGISEEGKQKLFKEFSQTEDSTTRKYGGTGLGLAICRNLVLLMGGDLGVNSEKDKGSEFWVRIRCGYRTGIRKSKKKEKEVEITEGIKILYAEDNLVNQQLTRMLLKKMGTDCDVACNGIEALNMFKKNKYQLILMDMQMPDLDGIESARKIREYEKNNPAGKPVYIVAVTANVFSEDKKECITAGMNDFISKPFKESELTNVLKNAIRLQ